MVSPRDREYRAQRRLVIGLLLVVWVGSFAAGLLVGVLHAAGVLR